MADTKGDNAERPERTQRAERTESAAAPSPDAGINRAACDAYPQNQQDARQTNDMLSLMRTGQSASAPGTNACERGLPSTAESTAAANPGQLTITDLWSSDNIKATPVGFTQIADRAGRKIPDGKHDAGDPNSVDALAAKLGMAPKDLKGKPTAACAAEIQLLGDPSLQPGKNMTALRDRLGIPSHYEDDSKLNIPDYAGKRDVWGTDPDKPVADRSPGELKGPPAYLDKLKQVMGNSIFDMGRDHNGILDTDLSKVLQKQGLPADAPLTVINVDAHADIYKAPGSTEGIADWGNAMISKNPNVKDYYWVLPNDFKTDPNFQPGDGKFNNIFSDAPSDFNAYVNNDTGRIQWGGEQPTDGNYRTVGIHKRTLDQMDDMKGKNVVLTTDLDHFANRGYDTAGDAKVPWKGEQAFQHYVDVLADKHVQPIFHYASFSPEYTKPESVPELMRFAAYSGEVARPDSAPHLSFHHDKVYPNTPADNDGISVTTDTNSGTRLMQSLFDIDSKTTNPNGLFDTKRPSAKLDAAHEAVQSIYNVDKPGAQRILHNFSDPKGVVDIRAMWDALQAACRTRYQ